MRITAVRPRPDRDKHMREFGPPGYGVACYDVDVTDDERRIGDGGLYGYSVIVSRDPIREDALRWHVSVAGDETPPWDHFVAIVHRMRPGVTFCVPMPTPDKWVNVHEHCLHAWQIDDDALEAQWAAEGRALRTPPT